MLKHYPHTIMACRHQDCLPHLVDLLPLQKTTTACCQAASCSQNRTVQPASRSHIRNRLHGTLLSLAKIVLLELSLGATFTASTQHLCKVSTLSGFHFGYVNTPTARPVAVIRSHTAHSLCVHCLAVLVVLRVRGADRTYILTTSEASLARCIYESRDHSAYASISIQGVTLRCTLQLKQC